MIYEYLLLDSTNLRDLQGIRCSCRQISQELDDRITKHAQGVLKAVEKDSIALRQSASIEGHTVSSPYIELPEVNTVDELYHLKIGFSLNSHFPEGKGQVYQPGEVRTKPVYFSEAFGNLQRLLALHLEYVTVKVPVIVPEDLDIWMPLVRAALLESCLYAFKGVMNKGEMNTRYIIFEILHGDVGPFPYPGHWPVLAFIRHEMKFSLRIRYEILGHDPKFEIFGASEWYDCQIETEEKMMDRLENVLRTGRRYAMQPLIRSTSTNAPFDPPKAQLFEPATTRRIFGAV